jgi:hypothetical protein
VAPHYKLLFKDHFILFCSVSLSWLCFSLSYCSNPVVFCIHCKNLLWFCSSWSKVQLLCASNLFFSVVAVLSHDGKISWGELWQEDPTTTLLYTSLLPFGKLNHNEAYSHKLLARLNAGC